MALSNWDTLVIGPDGKSSAGYFKFPNEVGIEVYKNWININKNNESCNINHGEISVFGIEVSAKRGPQNSIFFLATGYNEDKSYSYVAGIGCYGYGNKTIEYLKLKGLENPEEAYPDGFWYTSHGGDNSKNGSLCYSYTNEKGERKEFKIAIDDDFELHPWIGVEFTTLEDFKNWLNEEIDEWDTSKKTWFDSIDWNDLLRFNQGDAYFAGVLDMDIPASIVGEQEQPLINDMLNSMKND